MLTLVPPIACTKGFTFSLCKFNDLRITSLGGVSGFLHDHVDIVAWSVTVCKMLWLYSWDSLACSNEGMCLLWVEASSKPRFGWDTLGFGPRNMGVPKTPMDGS